MSALLKFEQQACWQECCSCGITFGLLKSWNDHLREKKSMFYCPSGHPQSYSGESDAAKARRLQAEVDSHRQELANAENRIKWSKDEASAAKAKATKLFNKLKSVETRINVGVCPHCNRTFKQLAAHMKCKHSDLNCPADAKMTS